MLSEKSPNAILPITVRLKVGVNFLRYAESIMLVVHCIRAGSSSSYLV